MADESGQQPGPTTTLTLTPEAAAALASAIPALTSALPAMAGAVSATTPGGVITVTITSGDTVYALSVSLPTTEQPDYMFGLTSAPTATPTQTTSLATFKFKDADNYLVQLQMPPMGGGGTTVSAAFNLQAGTP